MDNQHQIPERFRQSIIDRNITLLNPADYVDYNTKLNFKCNIHEENIFSKTPHSIRNGRGCNICANITRSESKIKYDLLTASEKIDEVTKGEYKLSSTSFKRVKDIYEFTHICKSSHSFTMSFYDFVIGGNRCSLCAPNPPITNDKITDIISRNDNFDLVEIGKISGKKTKINLIHTSCNNIIELNYRDITRHDIIRCPICNPLSIGESKIMIFLDRNNISYVGQKTYTDLINESGNNLRFDFFLENNNTCIEFDGIQHYQAIDAWGGVDALNTIIKHDVIKNEYCRNNGINLVRIKYDQINDIDNILSKEFCSTTIPDTGVGSSDPKH